MRQYSVFGLRVRSGIDLPELFEALGEGDADVDIELGAIDAPAMNDGLTAVAGGLLLTIPDVGRFLISDGDRIMIEPLHEVDARNVRLFLLGSAFGVLLHQRGLLPLHANAVEIGGKAVAFMGGSGAGKSTLAAWFHDNGYPVLADDVSVVRYGQDMRAYVAVGLPRLRLWRDALEFTSRAPEQFQRSYAGDSPYDKFDVPTGSNAAVEADRELAAVFELSRGDTLTFERLEGVDLVNAVYAHTYRGEFLTVVGGKNAHWSAAVRLARSVPFFRVARPWNLATFDQQFACIVDHVKTQLGLAR